MKTSCIKTLKGWLVNNKKYDGLKGITWGGVKGRMNQMASALGLVQLKKYPAKIAEIDKNVQINRYIVLHVY